MDVLGGGEAIRDAAGHGGAAVDERAGGMDAGAGGAGSMDGGEEAVVVEGEGAEGVFQGGGRFESHGFDDEAGGEGALGVQFEVAEAEAGQVPVLVGVVSQRLAMHEGVVAGLGEPFFGEVPVHGGAGASEDDEDFGGAEGFGGAGGIHGAIAAGEDGDAGRDGG